MRSKFLVLTVTAVFLMAVGFPVLAHDGRIPNVIYDPGEGDEHPWGGDHRFVEDPEFNAQPLPDPYAEEGSFFFIRVAVYGSWSRLAGIVWEFSVGNDNTDIPATIDNNTNVQGTRDN